MSGSARGNGKDHQQDDIAIVGMACLYPGAPDLRHYWQNIVDKRDCVTDPPDEWGAELYLDPESDANDRVYTTKGGFLGDLARFDPLLHGVMPSSVDGGEPDQFLALEIAHRAMVDADALRHPLPGDRVEVVLGRGTYINRGFSTVVQHGVIVDRVLSVLRSLHPEHDEAELAEIKRQLKASLPPFNSEMAPALVPNLVTGRIANRLDFQGVNYIIDAACASSHIAIERGIEDLRAGKCDMAVVGGVHASTPAPIFMIFCQLAALSRHGQIRPFDRDADGTLLAEGLGVLVLKRLSEAEEAGDRIYALLKAVGTASDGRGLGMLAPRLEGESLALRRAYEQSGIDPRSVGLLEAHGTATNVGDETEIAALKSVFGGRAGDAPTCALGSVKSMIGHCLPAAGSAGVIKAALALYHKVLPATLNCEHPNPDLGIEESPFYINTRTRPWIHGAASPRRAGVNAFGFGGINAHAVLEEYTGRAERERGIFMKRPCEVLVVEAGSRDALVQATGEIVSELSAVGAPDLGDVAARRNLNLQRAPWRLAVVATDSAEAAAKLKRAATRLADESCQRIRDRRGIYFTAEPLYRPGALAFLFPGEGSQYPYMLEDLCLHFPAVRSWFDLIDRAFVDHPRGILPSQAIFPPPMPGKTNGEADERALWRMDIGPEAIFAANQAMFAQLQALGIRPDAILGHSTGEYSALYAAGANVYGSEARLCDDIIALNRHYEELAAANLVAEGQLIAVAGVSTAQLDEVVAQRDDLFLAMDNCPHQQVVCALSGESKNWLADALQPLGAILTPLPFNRAYHTPAFQGFCDRLTTFFARLDIRPPSIRLYSCMTAEAVPDDAEEVRRLAINQWANKVRFRETIERMYEDGVRLFVECGPRNNLTAFVNDILGDRPGLAAAADVQFQGGVTQLCHLIAQLAAQGVPMNLTGLYAGAASVPEEAAGEAAAPPRRHQPMTLKMGLQPLTLAGVDGPAAAPPSSQAAVARQPEGATEAPAAAAEMPSSPAQAPPQDVPVSQQQDAEPALALDDASPEVMAAYHQTMEHFLDLQREVMEAYLGPGEDVVAAHGEAGPLLASEAIFPLLREIDTLEPGQRLSARSVFDLEADSYLEDHTIGRLVSTRDPQLPALPVVPLTFSMELMAEAAAALLPDLVVCGMEEVRAYRWIALDRGSVELEVSAERRDSEAAAAVFVTVRAAESAAGRPRPPLIEGTILLAPERSPPPEARKDPFRGQRAARWRPEEIYEEIMFHGPRLRAIESMDLWGEDGSEGTFVGLPHDRLFGFTEAPCFQSDAISLDAAGQLIGMWTADHLKRGFHVFPFRMEKLEIFRDRLAPGERACCRAYIELIGDTEVRSDIEIIAADGGVQSRISGWWDRRFDLPERFFHLRRNPAEVYLAKPAGRILEAIGNPDHVSCMILEDLSLEFLESSSEIWLRVLAHLLLSRDERRQWQELDSSPLRRRADWLLGRAAAKDAVRDLLRRRQGLVLCPADVLITTEDSGRPSLAAGWRDEWGPIPQLSISHKDGHAIAIAAAAEHYRAAGVDIESVSDLPREFVETAFTPAERDLLQAGDNADPPTELIIRLWSAKEAAGKAAGLGMPDILRRVEVKSVVPGNGRVTVSVAAGEGSGPPWDLEVVSARSLDSLISAVVVNT